MLGLEALTDKPSRAGLSARATLSPLSGLVVIDEIQRDPALFEVLRPLADRPRRPVRFLILASASPDLVRGVSESLAGRAEVVELGGFDLTEVGTRNTRTLWLRGGLPGSCLARNRGVASAASSDRRGRPDCTGYMPYLSKFTRNKTV